MCICSMLLMRVKVPTSFVTSIMFIDIMAPINREVRSWKRFLVSAVSAVLRMVLKKRSKLTKRLMGYILPVLGDT